MSLFYENPLAQVDPALYLAGYTAALIALGVAAWRRRQARDTTRGRALPEPLEAPSPEAMAYLNGGLDGLARLVLYDLVRRGWLELREADSVFTTDSRVERAAAPPPVSYLTPLEVEVWRQTERPGLMSELFSTRNLPGHLAAFGERLEHELVSRDLMADERGRQRGWREAAMFVAAAALPGLYRMAVALHEGTGGWFAFLFWGVIGAGVIGALARPSWRTDLGDRLVRALRDTYDQMRDHLDVWGEAAERHLPMLASIFGAGTLLMPLKRRAGPRRRQPLPTNVEMIEPQDERPRPAGMAPAETS